jgi:hypothetical protein
MVDDIQRQRLIADNGIVEVHDLGKSIGIGTLDRVGETFDQGWVIDWVEARCDAECRHGLGRWKAAVVPVEVDIESRSPTVFLRRVRLARDG